MKKTLALTLVVCLVVSALPVTTQAQGAFDLRSSAPMAGPLARAATHEAARLAATGEPQPSSIESIQQGRKAGLSDWSRVRKIVSGTEIIVIVTGLRPAKRYLVTLDESQLIVLNLTDPALPAAARDMLRDAASHHPEYITAAQTGGTFVLQKSVHVGPDGVFVADRKVADLTQVVETIGRHDVVEINTAERERNRLGCVGAGYAGWLLGVPVGGMAGGMIGATGHSDGAIFGGMALGAIVGGLTGANWLYHKCRHKSEEVIYRAP
jgi:hypothetical protein